MYIDIILIVIPDKSISSRRIVFRAFLRALIIMCLIYYQLMRINRVFCLVIFLARETTKKRIGKFDWLAMLMASKLKRFQKFTMVIVDRVA